MRVLVLAVLTAAIAATSCGKTLLPGYCRTNGDCTGDSICNNNPDGGTFTCSDGGAPDAPAGPDGGDAGDAPEAGGASDAPIEKPFMCITSADCADASMSGVCEATSGKCVECLMDLDCTATATPICDKTANTCVRCTTDAQCAAKDPNPGVCMVHQDGRCASDSETIYVKNTTGCSMTAGVGGTQSVPYCFPQLGIEAVGTTKRVVVMRGPDSLRFWTLTAAGDQVTVIGQTGAAISPGADVGVHITAGNVYIRGLKISGGSKAGIVADGGAELRMDRCIVQDNSAGGILIDGAAFHIRDTTVVGNGPGTFGIATWGGVLVNNPASTPNATPNALEFLTVQNNMAIGISCSAAVPAMGILASGNVTGQVNPTCAIVLCDTAGALCGARP